MEKREFIIVVDSSSNLSKEYRDANNIPYVKMGLTKKYKDYDQEVSADIDWELYTNKELNDWMRDGIVIKTSQVSHNEFSTVFTRLVKENKEVLYIACSSALSGSYNYSLAVRDEVLESYPDGKIICVDSLNCDHAIALMAMDAINMKNEGKTIEEVAAYLEENKLCYHQFATVETLEYLKKAGRVKAAAAFFGNIFGVKPMIISDAKGQNYAVKKVKGRRAALLELINVMKEKIVDPQNQVVYLEHADSTIDSEFVKQHIIDTFSPKDVYVTNIGPITGTSLGPGTIVVSYLSVEETIKGE